MKRDNKDNSTLSLEDVNQILSDSLLQLAERKISPKRAQSISRIALALSKNITHLELKKRVEFLEHILQDRK